MHIGAEHAHEQGAVHMRRSPPASAQLTSIGAQKRSFEEVTPDFSALKPESQAPMPVVSATPEFDDPECRFDKLPVKCEE